jgi:exosortase D (VPLPA-CTERM-specific)
MSAITILDFFKRFWQPLAVAALVVFLYLTVLPRLVQVWWTDENYSHGLLIPFIIGYILWSEKESWHIIEKRPAFLAGAGLILISILMLLAGTLGAELFTQRVSLVVLLVGLALYFFGWLSLRFLAVPLVLLFLAIPIPTILFNQLAFPLQLLATDLAVWAVRLFAVPVIKAGNIIEVLPQGAMQAVNFEVVEACSGIRSLMTLMTLALVYAFFTRRETSFEKLPIYRNLDFWRAVFLMATAMPIAVVTNAARIVATVLTAYYYGKETADGTLHDVSGWLVYLAALVLLFLASLLFDKLIRRGKTEEKEVLSPLRPFTPSPLQVLLLICALLVGGVFVHWRERIGDNTTARQSLRNLPVKIGEWQKYGEDAKFSPEIESVLRADDYLMRDYFLPATGATANIYVGYYNSQRTGATYHSPRNCLPGSGWVMHDPAPIKINLPNGREFTANRYLIENDGEKFLMIYWYQGRGRFTASEYEDKLMTVWDSATRRRSDGALVRVITPLEGVESKSVIEAVDVSSQLAVSLNDFVPN